MTRPTNRPRPTIRLIGEDGNAFSILGRAREALIREEYSKEEIDGYVKEATSGDYDHLLRVTMDWFEVD